MEQIIFENKLRDDFLRIPMGKDGFVWKDEHIFMHRLQVNTYQPLIPAGSILLVDSRSRWPIDGSLYLLRFKNISAAEPQIALVSSGRTRNLQWGFHVWLYGFPGDASFFEHDYEEGKDRVVDWVLGRVIGVSIMYR